MFSCNGTNQTESMTMAEDFRELIDELRAADELIEIEKPVDIRHIATLVDQSDKALMFTNVNGYDMPVVSGVTNSRERLAIAAGCDFSDIEGRLREGHLEDHDLLHRVHAVCGLAHHEEVRVVDERPGEVYHFPLAEAQLGVPDLRRLARARLVVRAAGVEEVRILGCNYKVAFGDKSSEIKLFNVAENARNQRVRRSSVKM